MELSEIESKLHALEKLYGLLLRNLEETCHSSSHKLDDEARYMLKNLLDMETERVIKAHSEIVASNRVVESYSSQQLIDSIMNTRFQAGEVLSQAPIGDQEVNQSNMPSTSSSSDNGKKRCSVCNKKQFKRSSVLSDGGGAQIFNEVNDLNPAGLIIENAEHNKSGLDDDTSIPFKVLSGSSKKNLSTQGGQYNSGSTGNSESLPSDNAAETSVNRKGIKCSSKEDADLSTVDASAGVEKIQSHIMALKLDAASLLPPRKRVARIGLMASVTDNRLPSMQMEGDKPVADIASSQAPEKSTNSPSLLVNQLTIPQLPTQTTIGNIEHQQKIGENSGQTKQNPQTLPKKVPSPDMRIPSSRFESLCKQIMNIKRLSSRRNRRGKGSGFQEHEAKKSKGRLIPSAGVVSQMNKEDRDNQVRRKNEGTTRQTVVDHTSHTVNPSQKPSRRRHLPLESPTLSLAEHEPRQSSVSEDRFLNNKSKIRRRMRKEPRDRREIEITDSDYSPRTNQVSSDSSNEIELDSGEAEIHDSGTPSSTSESEDVYSLPRRTRRLPASFTSGSESETETEVYSSASRSDTEVYSSASRSDTESYASTSGSESPQETGNSSNKRHKYPSYVRSRPRSKRNQEQSYSSEDTTASTRESGGVHTEFNRDREKRRGFKNLKNKMAIVFHHRHNHHHHIHRSDKKDKNNPAAAAKKNPGKSLLKRSKKVTDLEREKDIKGERVAEKLGKSIVRGKAKKTQPGHFVELMKGLLRHKRNSKQSRPPRLHKETKKAPKTSSWWKLLRNQKGSKAHKKANAKKRYECD